VGAPGTARSADGSALPKSAGTSTGELSSTQLAELRSAGSTDPDPATYVPGALEEATRRSQDDLLTSALTITEAAALLGVDEVEVLAAVAARELYAVPSPTGPLLLRAQLTADGRLPPGMGRVLSALPPEVSPLVVNHFLTHPHVDLVLDGERVDPRAWLTAGHKPEVVVALARGLLDVP
jgi:hypothetical protein